MKVSRNSGRYERKDVRTPVERCLKLDARRIAFDLSQGSGQCTITSNGQPSFVVRLERRTLSSDLITVALSVEVRSMPSIVRLTSTITPLGGLRWWWVCNGCKKRRAALYMRGPASMAACRVCLRLTYRCCQENRRPSKLWKKMLGPLADIHLESMIRRYVKIERRLPDRNRWRRYKRRARRSATVDEHEI